MFKNLELQKSNLGAFKKMRVLVLKISRFLRATLLQSTGRPRAHLDVLLHATANVIYMAQYIGYLCCTIYHKKFHYYLNVSLGLAPSRRHIPSCCVSSIRDGSHCNSACRWDSSNAKNHCAIKCVGQILTDRVRSATIAGAFVVDGGTFTALTYNNVRDTQNTWRQRVRMRTTQ